jgi:hypothetical protein
MRSLLAHSFLLAACLTACAASSVAPPPVKQAVSGGSVGEATAALQAAILEVQTEVQLATPSDPVPSAPQVDAFKECAVVLITRWEVSGVATYNRRWKGVYWPGGSSGPTWGIGWDGGHQTPVDTARAWNKHPDVVKLATSSGVIGMSAKQRIGEWRGITTPYPYAAEVFASDSLPRYTAAARRALGSNFDSLPAPTRCALTSLGYNRGWLTTGDKRREIRHIRDVCLPAQDKKCVAAQLRSMKRLWPTVPGLQARREDEARIAESP